MSAFIYSKFSFVEIISENGTIKAKMFEKEGFLDSGSTYTQDELQIYGLLKNARTHLQSNSSNRRLRKNIEQFVKAFDSIRNVKISNEIKLDVNV